jgi:hypothetical protein
MLSGRVMWRDYAKYLHSHKNSMLPYITSLFPLMRKVSTVKQKTLLYMKM